MTRYEEAERFAARLRALRERANYSYEALAQKTGISRSSLHRYCAGSSVPQDYGVAHRIATVCGATPAELRELHRLWALSDAERATSDAQVTPATEEPEPDEPPQEPVTGETRPAAETETDEERPETTEPAPSPEPPAPRRTWLPRGRRLTVVTAVVTVVVLGIVAWGMSMVSSHGKKAEADDDRVLFSAACRPVIGMGQHDTCVTEVQTLLRRHGAVIDVDGDFGPQTLRRVTAFQVFAGIPPNGVVGDATKKALYDSKVSLTTWSPQKVRERIREVFSAVPDDAVAIADCQSFLDPLHILPNTNGTRNWGLFQISDTRLRELGGTPRKALDPEWNIQAAKKLWSRDHDFHDWPHCERALHQPSPSPSKS
jgi:transcriptional regulator with XRE-family HTH domain